MAKNKKQRARARKRKRSHLRATGSNRRLKLRSFIISPISPCYRCWQFFLLLLVFYAAWVCPFEFGFLNKSKGPHAIKDNVVNGFFAIDIVVTFFVGYIDKSSNMFIDNPKLIALRYAKTWLFFDVISTVPFELACKVLAPPLKEYVLFSMLRLWHLRRVGAFFARFLQEKDSNANYIWVCFSKLLCVSLLSAHIAACFLYFLAANHDMKTPLFSQVADGKEMHLWGCYVTSVYWAVLTIGYGDLYLVMAFGILYLLCIILVLNGYHIGNMIDNFFHITSRTRNYFISQRPTDRPASSFAQRQEYLLEQMLTNFSMGHETDLEEPQCQERPTDRAPSSFAQSFVQLHEYLLEQMLANFSIGHETDLEEPQRQERPTDRAPSSFAQSFVQLHEYLLEQMLANFSMGQETDLEEPQRQEVSIGSFPKAIQSSRLHNLFVSVVEKVYLFHGVSNYLLLQLVAEMELEQFYPMEVVILQREEPTDFYVLVSGAAELVTLYNGIEKVIGEAKVGDIVGEIGVLCYWPQFFTVRTKQLCRFLRLNHDTFINLAHSNVGDWTTITSNFLKHLYESSDPMIERVLVETDVILDLGIINLSINLCFAANKDYRVLLRQLLVNGFDPNEADENGRTPLHIAASRGSQKCVAMLLLYKANPNKKDLNGSIPLWEAMLGGHESVIKLLVDNGGDISCADVGYLACSAVEQNNLELLKKFIRYGGDVTQPRSNGRTALHMAACNGNIEIVKLLMQQEADINKPDVDGWTPRTLADHHGHEDIIEMFFNITKGKRP